MSETLYRKYRPNNFDTVFGQEYIKKSIQNALDQNKLAHAYLFSGPRGVGKTTIARIIAKSVNCMKNGISSKPCLSCENCVSIAEGNNLDIIEIDAASNRGIDEIRSLKESINYQPVRCRMKVYIIDEIHMLTNEAFNALLKTLEEPPKHAIFILATTEINKLPDTIISRCICYNFKTLSENEAIDMMRNCVEKENIKIDDDSLKLIFKKSGGSARDAFSILEQISSTNFGEDITEELVKKTLGMVPREYFVKFNEYLKNEQKEELVKFVDEMYEDGIQIEQFLKDFCDFLKANEKDIDYISLVITNIYSSLNIFKNEDDIRIIVYIIIYNILKVKKTVSTVSVSTNVKNVEFDYKKFLNQLKEQGMLIPYSVLSEFKFVEIKNASIYIKQTTNREYTKAIISDYEYRRQIEEQIYDMLGVRYTLEIIDKKYMKNFDGFYDKVRSLFEAEKI
ncbi:DNA polymerase III subunit gamma/tau [Sneathia sp. DSM 16630]|uniref:DNA polymerase III subunit gamma/tau n=1 Tax=uncultured Sneathia sp. TaxID=278067 RepID=UPI002598D4CB|nr:DNA polymerase III subunit gamma/tau [uncultured Sneathia sp.]MBE2989534.1 DNA polymerase III subunit gamma/tau [Sneathia sp. DSM 16630]